MSLVYQIATLLALVLVGPFLLLRRGRHYLASLPGRWGRYDGVIPDSPVWLHAVSVGEVGVANTLVRGLPPEVPLLVTTITPTGQERARALFGSRAAVAYLPFDLAPLVRRFLDRFSPRALILVEGDLWPLVLAETRRRGIPIAVVNGRVSDKSFRRMSRGRRLLGPILEPVDRFGMQSDVDRDRLLELGVGPARVTVTGNLKFETPEPPPRPDLIAAIQGLAGDRPILIAGSTMAGEEELVLEAFRSLGSGQRALLLLAPRHPERWNLVAELANRGGFTLTRRSRPENLTPSADVLLLDSLGELAVVYATALGCFVGGTLVPTGGHNPLEPAQHGVAVCVGPSMENFRQIAEAFDSQNAWRRVEDERQLAEAWDSWLRDPTVAKQLGARGKLVVVGNRGSLGRTRAFLQPILQPPSTGEAAAGGGRR